jgi:hypothetical protein
LTTSSMSAEHIVVDGSNIATEGRNSPSLAQLEDAVTELRREFPDAEVTVIVDATFAHRIDPSELERFETAALAGEYAYPPAGAIGRGDAFLLRVAEKVDATVLSNDSFQEFHGEHPWLFERGRLLGATPVPGIGWIFVPRAPVRGPTSRRAVKDSDKARRKVSKAIEAATKEAVSPPGGQARGAAKRTSRRDAKQVDESAGNAGATAAGEQSAGGRRRPRPGPHPSAVNDPLTFISFIAEHPLGKEVTGRVDSYTSHGAVVFVDGVQCYVPLTNLADPAPRSARTVLKRNEERTFVVTALDPQRRGVELALPEFARVSGRPSDETIAAEVRLAKKKAAPVTKPAAAVGKKAAAGKQAAAAAPAKRAAAVAPAKRAPQVKKAGKVVPRKAPAKKAPATRAAPAEKASSAQKAAPAEKASSAQKAAPPTKAAPAEKASSAQKAAPPTKAAPDRQAAAVKKMAGGKKAAAPQNTSARRKKGEVAKDPAPVKASSDETTGAQTAKAAVRNRGAPRKAPGKKSADRA